MSQHSAFRQQELSSLNEDLCPLPHESILSSLWRFAWRNGLSGSHLLHYCKKPPSFPTSSSPSFERLSVDQFAFASGWKIEEAERMCKLVDGTWWHQVFRYCPLCLEQGYHSYWYQSQYIDTCPIDGVRLETTCQHCGNTLPQYGLCRPLLNRSYLCSHCSNPISGVWPTIESRLTLQRCEDQVSQAFSPLYQWWIESGPVREVLLENLPSAGGKDVSHYPFPYRSFMRQWVLDRNEIANPSPVVARRSPRLVILQWKLRLKVGPGWDVKLYERVSWDGRHRTRVMGIYRATLRRLKSLIFARCAFTEADYRRHLVITSPDSQRLWNDGDLPLLALCVMRRTLEPYLSLDPSRIPRSVIDPSGGEISHFWHRTRICWRIAFIGMYVEAYWSLVSTRSEAFKFLNPPTYNPCAMRQFEEGTEDPRFIYFKGSIAFPEIDGLVLNSKLSTI